MYSRRDLIDYSPEYLSIAETPKHYYCANKEQPRVLIIASYHNSHVAYSMLMRAGWYHKEKYVGTSLDFYGLGDIVCAPRPFPGNYCIALDKYFQTKVIV